MLNCRGGRGFLLHPALPGRCSTASLGGSFAALQVDGSPGELLWDRKVPPVLTELCLLQRLAIAKEFGDKAAERRAYSNLGNAHIFLGRFDISAEYYK